jgi:flagellar biosynthesis protein
VKPPATITKAVAIEYERGGDEAPRVTASGNGAIAEQILAIAFDRGIKVRQDAELVEILSLVEVDSPIPLEAFTAVAEILAFVYQANAARKPRPPVWKE